MFNRLRSKVTRTHHSPVTASLDKGSEFEGKLNFEGTARIGGKFRGEIYTNDSLIISEGAMVEGRIEADTVVINGEMIGDVMARSRVEIHRPGILRGTIITNSLYIEEGVVFEGTTKMIDHIVEASVSP